MSIPFVSPRDVEGVMSWKQVTDAIEAGHKGLSVELGDLLLRQDENALLNRAAWIKGKGIALKSVTVFPDNFSASPPLPAVQGALILFDDRSGVVQAIIDGPLVTKWKTAADSVLGAKLLARPDCKRLCIIGSGTVAASLVEAYGEIFPELEHISVWSRKFSNAERLVARIESHCTLEAVASLPEAVFTADIVSCATLSKLPVLQGEWVRPGTHVDLIGAFRPDMREADDELMRKGRIFVDARATTIGEIGELMIPIAAGTFSQDDVLGDLVDLCAGDVGRRNEKEITVYKNGGGAHLDLMTARVIYDNWCALRA